MKVDHFVKEEVIKLTRTVVFRRMKFVRCQASLLDYTSTDSVGRYICDHLNVKAGKRNQWWMAYSKVVDAGITGVRNSSILGNKNDWISE